MSGHIPTPLDGKRQVVERRMEKRGRGGKWIIFEFFSPLPLFIELRAETWGVRGTCVEGFIDTVVGHES